eukprot:767365-Hanusia_phi.AAC.10
MPRLWNVAPRRTAALRGLLLPGRGRQALSPIPSDPTPESESRVGLQLGQTTAAAEGANRTSPSCPHTCPSPATRNLLQAAACLVE